MKDSTELKITIVGWEVIPVDFKLHQPYHPVHYKAASFWMKLRKSLCKSKSISYGLHRFNYYKKNTVANFIRELRILSQILMLLL